MVEAEGAPPPAELASRASSAFRLLRHALRHDARDIRLGALDMVRALNRRDLLMSPDEVAAGATSTAAGESPKELRRSFRAIRGHVFLHSNLCHARMIFENR